MFHSIRRAFFRRTLTVSRIINPIHSNSCLFVQQTPFSSAISNQTDKDSLFVSYLVKTFGFSRAKACRASKYIKVSNTENPELVRSFLENQGLTPEQIGTTVRYYPQILLFDPVRILLPKVECFRSLGISQSELINIFVTAPGAFGRSLTKQIIPTFSYLQALFKSSGTSFGFTRRLGGILFCSLESYLIPNVETLRDAGVPDHNIVYLLQTYPRAVLVDSGKFRKVVEEVKQMDICPSQVKFIEAVIVLRSMTKSTWDTKVSAYKKWGWSEDDVILAFQRYPSCMKLSTERITNIMNYMVNEMGFHASVMLKNPVILWLSFEKRIKPRCRVYKVLLENGLIKEGSHLSSLLKFPEDKFLKRFVHQYEIQAPGLLQLYHEKTADSKI